jgi:hypothetical protein
VISKPVSSHSVAVTCKCVHPRPVPPSRVPLPQRPPPPLPSQDASVGCFRRVAQPAALGDSLGNQFRITLRRCRPSAAAVHERLLRCCNGQFINYYGVQRVGDTASALQHCAATGAWACVDSSDLLQPPAPPLSLSLSLCRVTCLWQRCCGCFPRQQKRRLGDAAGGQPDAAGGLVRGAARMVLCARRWLYKEILADFIQQGGVRSVCAGAQRPQRRAGPRHARLLRRGERECAGEANRQGSAAATRGGVGACEGWMGSGGSSSS